MSSTPAVSVVIPTYNRRESVRRALVALADQTLAPGAYEVIVSVDGSNDHTREMLAGFDAPYALTSIFAANGGRAAACNRGIRAARGDLIVLLDDDMVASPGLLAAHLAAHPDGRTRAVIGAAPMAPGSGADAASEYVRQKFNAHLTRLARADHAFALRDFYSGNLSIRRHVIVDAGGFDEAFTVYGNEDLELSLRLRAAGVEFVFSEDALASQHYTKDFAALAHDNLCKGRTAVLLAAKHPATRPLLKLGMLERRRWRTRLLIGALLRVTKICPPTSRAVVRVMTALGRWRAPGLARIYSLALDYFYLSGARAAEADHARGSTA
jgi:GT2 family glycosyltransferase